MSLAALIGSVLASYGTLASAERARGTSQTCHGHTATIVGTAGDDNGENAIIGTSRRDVIDARGGNDLVKSHAGRDIVCGATGADQLSLGRGDDRGYGGNGTDLLGGRAGDDKLYGNDGDDGMAGGKHEDLCSGGSGRDFARIPDCEHIRGATPINPP